MDRKFLLGPEPDDPGFGFTVLGDLRARLIEHGLEERFLSLDLERIRGPGLPRGGWRSSASRPPRASAARTTAR